jgi:serine/threonine-protein kinase
MTKCQDLGQSFGSPIYYSPEQCMGKELQPASDMYSLGCVVFEALAGRPPFRGANSIQTAAAHMTAAPPSTGSPEVDAFFAIALAKRSENRFQSGSEFKGALAKLPST